MHQQMTTKRKAILLNPQLKRLIPINRKLSMFESNKHECTNHYDLFIASTRRHSNLVMLNPISWGKNEKAMHCNFQNLQH